MENKEMKEQIESIIGIEINNNKEKTIEDEVKEILNITNFFDMLLAAKEFEKDYKTSDFYKMTKIPLMEVLKEAKSFYTFSIDTIVEKIQTAINNLDLTKLNSLFDEMGNLFQKENAETMKILGELKDFKDVIKKD